MNIVTDVIALMATSRRRAAGVSGPVEQILERPANPYTIRLMEDVPKLAGLARPGSSTSPASG